MPLRNNGIITILQDECVIEEVTFSFYLSFDDTNIFACMIVVTFKINDKNL